MAKKSKEATGGIIDRGKYSYDSTRYRDADGKVRHSRGNQDAVARALILYKQSGGDSAAVIRTNSLTFKADIKSMNPGQQRMAVGNALRGLVRKGTPVTIGDVTVKKLDQKEPVLEAVAPLERKSAAPKAAKKATSKKAGGRVSRRNAASSETVAA